MGPVYGPPIGLPLTFHGPYKPCLYDSYTHSRSYELARWSARVGGAIGLFKSPESSPNIFCKQKIFGKDSAHLIFHGPSVLRKNGVLDLATEKKAPKRNSN